MNRSEEDPSQIDFNSPALIGELEEDIPGLDPESLESTSLNPLVCLFPFPRFFPGTTFGSTCLETPSCFGLVG